jgi:purine-binding chemotaxis protein CheW
MIAIRETVPAREAASAATAQLVVFSLAGESYALPVANVREVLRLQPITSMPAAPEFVEGIISLRGRVIVVVDLRRRFGMPAAERTAAARIIVVRAGRTFVGLIVDAVQEVVTVPATVIQPVPETTTRAGSRRFLSGVARAGDGLIVIVNLEELFSAEEARQFDGG